LAVTSSAVRLELLTEVIVKRPAHGTGTQERVADLQRRYARRPPSLSIAPPIVPKFPLKVLAMTYIRRENV